MYVVYDRITMLCFIIGDTGSVWWTNDRIIFVSFTVEECKERMHELKGTRTHKIILKSLFPDFCSRVARIYLGN